MADACATQRAIDAIYQFYLLTARLAISLHQSLPQPSQATTLLPLVSQLDLAQSKLEALQASLGSDRQQTEQVIALQEALVELRARLAGFQSPPEAHALIASTPASRTLVVA